MTLIIRRSQRKPRQRVSEKQDHNQRKDVAALTSITWALLLIISFAMLMTVMLACTDTLLRKLDVRDLWVSPIFRGFAKVASKRQASVLLAANDTVEVLPVWPLVTDSLDVASCEVIRTFNFVAQPINTMSCIVYLLAGFFIIGQGMGDFWKLLPQSSSKVGQQKEPHDDVTWDDARVVSRLRRRPGWSILLGASLVYAGVSGIVWHASLTNLAWQLDDAAKWTVCITFCVFSIVRAILPYTVVTPQGEKQEIDDDPLVRLKGPFIDFVAVCVVAACSFGLYYYGALNEAFSEYLVAAVVCSFFLSIAIHWYLYHRFIKCSWKTLVVGVSFLGIGVSALVLERRGVICNDGATWFPGHSIWHIASAIGMFILYQFFRGDNVHQNAILRVVHRDTLDSQDIELGMDDIEMYREQRGSEGSSNRNDTGMSDDTHSESSCSSSGTETEFTTASDNHPNSQFSATRTSSLRQSSVRHSLGLDEIAMNHIGHPRSNSQDSDSSVNSLTARQFKLREKLQMKARELNAKLSKLSPRSFHSKEKRVRWADQCDK